MNTNRNKNRSRLHYSFKAAKLNPAQTYRQNSNSLPVIKMSEQRQSQAAAGILKLHCLPFLRPERVYEHFVGANSLMHLHWNNLMRMWHTHFRKPQLRPCRTCSRASRSIIHTLESVAERGKSSGGCGMTHVHRALQFLFPAAERKGGERSTFEK